MNNTDVQHLQNFSTEFSALNNPAYLGAGASSQNQIPRNQSQAEMYERISGTAKNRFADRERSEGARNFKSSAQLQQVYNSITPSNNNSRLSNIPKDKEYV